MNRNRVVGDHPEFSDQNSPEVHWRQRRHYGAARRLSKLTISAGTVAFRDQPVEHGRKPPTDETARAVLEVKPPAAERLKTCRQRMCSLLEMRVIWRAYGGV